MKFYHNKKDAKHSEYHLKVLGKMIGISDEQVLEHFEKDFPSKIKAQLLEIEDTDAAI